jgi:hypothetical protein
MRHLCTCDTCTIEVTGDEMFVRFHKNSHEAWFRETAKLNLSITNPSGPLPGI